jgi:hypothetical protein
MAHTSTAPDAPYVHPAEVMDLGIVMSSIDLTNASADTKVAWTVGIAVWLCGMGALAIFF